MSDFSEQRMSICNTCPYNIEGMCVLCGCDLTTKVKDPKESCPHTPLYWGQYVELKMFKQSPQARIAEGPPQLNVATPQQSEVGCIPCNKHRH